jgi:hypothetical protein
VFIDYLDGQLYLVSYSNGQRSITTIHNPRLDIMHTYRLVWTDSLVYVEVDGGVTSCLSTNIPDLCLPFMLSVSGSDYRCGADRLVVDTVEVFTHGFPLYTLGPEVLLVWPQNSSIVQTSDSIQFNLYGSDEYLTYTWDNGPSNVLEWPWKVPVPNTLGVHNLEILVWNYTGGWITRDYTFTVQPTQSILQGQELASPPILDGTIETWERDITNENNLALLREDNSIHPVDICIGYWNDSLYIGIYTNVIAGLSTRLDMLIDADADGIWYTDQTSPKPDFRLSIGSPDVEDTENGIWYSDYSRAPNSHFGNIILKSATQNAMLMAEFSVPFQNVTMEGLSFGLILTQGGMVSQVLSNDQEQDTVLVDIEFTELPVSYSSFYIYLISIGAVILAAIGVVIFRRPKPRVSPHLTLDDEQVDRLRTLILSYPRISLSRLRTMTGFDSETFDRSLEFLIDRGLVDIQILPSGEIIRNHQHNKSI